jgi:hypothetical protein
MPHRKSQQGVKCRQQVRAMSISAHCATGKERTLQLRFIARFMVAVMACLQGAVIKGANLAPTKEDGMSSTLAEAAQTDQADVTRVRNFLRIVGLRRIDSKAKCDMKRDPLIVLTAEFLTRSEQRQGRWRHSVAATDRLYQRLALAQDQRMTRWVGGKTKEAVDGH